MPSLPPFHLAFPVTDLKLAREFYIQLLGCREGRSAPDWVDFDFYGHQIVAHLISPALISQHNNIAPQYHHKVDGHTVPIPHFGVVLTWESWHELSVKLTASNVRFVLSPGIRFAGQPGEQATFFILDPFGNALEFKAFKEPSRLFAR